MGSSGNYNYSVDADWANRPVNLASFWDACRFTNWLHNGQGAGDTETGAYTLNGYNGTDGRTIQRNANWKWAVTSEDEWYKAAYYKGGGSQTGYWDYATASDTMPGRDMDDVSGNNANYALYYNDGYLLGEPYYRTEAGEFQNSESAYGTFDQSGNAFEWTETLAHNGYDRVARGGSALNEGYRLQASTCSWGFPNEDRSAMGFRVVQVVPEPSSLLGLLGGVAGLARCGLRRRKS